MIRQIIKIDEDKCIGCGLCASACHQGAIQVIDKKAKLLRDDYCDGLGNCLPACPTNAISIEHREAINYNKAVAPKHLNAQMDTNNSCDCILSKPKININPSFNNQMPTMNQSQLRQWPIQIKLVAVNASYFDNCNLLISADCAAYAYSDFHCEFMKNRITLIGCPKLDDTDYAIKLTKIFSDNNIKSICVARMEVGCCSGIEKAVKIALSNCGKDIHLQVITISTDGKILD